MHYFCIGFLYLCSGLIQKVMAKNLLNKYVWLVETINKAKKITFEEINEKWLNNDMSENKPLPLRTFHKWRQAIEGLFDLIIENENCGQYRYYIQNAEDLKNGSMRSWLFNTLTISNLIMESASIKNKILFEEIPDGEQFLPMILEALKKNQVLEMTYQSYNYDESFTFEIEPYCLKAFKQRWYLVGRSPYYDKIMIYALDNRFKDLQPTNEFFDYPKDFKAEDYFDDCFGIIADKKVKVETVKLKVSAGQANYLRSLTLHQTQKEIERTDEYSIFTVRLRPTFDFQQEILSMGSDIEVLSPKWFREDTAERVKAMWNKYKEDK